MFFLCFNISAVEMSSLISFGSKNILPNGFNNVLSFDLTNSALNFKNMEVALNSIQLFNSQFNIDAVYNNTTFQIVVPTGSTTQTITIDLGNGYYSYTDINNFIQARLVAVGAYLIDAVGNTIVHVKLRENRTYYAAQFDLLTVPTTLPSGWSRPPTGIYSSTGSGLPSSTLTPILRLSENDFKNVVGFTAGDYPAVSSSSNASFLSVVPPQINPVSSYMLRCNIVKNDFTNPSDILTVFSTQGTDIGQLIDVKPSELSWIKVSDGSYSNITLTITDQDGGFVKFYDPAILITILIRERK